MKDDVLICWQCGSPMKAGRKKPVIFRGEPGLAVPMFCSTKCAHVHKPHNPDLTIQHLDGLISQFQVGQK